jgi:CRP/FNR family transcriptional regulator, cyclic AMP receptor protein
MNLKRAFSGLKEIRLPMRAGSPTGFARRARALFQQPEAAAADRGSLVEFLGRVSLFADVDRRDLVRLARIVHAREYADGEFICEEGRPGVASFIVRRGVVEVVRRAAGGEETSLALLEPPASFEESAAIGAAISRWFSVRARGPVSLLALGKSDLEALMDGSPALANKVLIRLAGIMAARLQMLLDAELAAESNGGSQP